MIIVIYTLGSTCTFLGLWCIPEIVAMREIITILLYGLFLFIDHLKQLR
jgi:hypothetical protein